MMTRPAHGLYGLEGAAAQAYLVAMGTVSRYAWLNRAVLMERVRVEQAGVFGADATALVADVPHNVVLQERPGGAGASSSDDPVLNIHRKGSTPAHAGQLALIPGSMGTASYRVKGLGNREWLSTCSHGAGRSVRRQVMRRAESVRGPDAADEVRAWRCVTLREERRIEVVPSAYKPIGPVIEAQEQAGLLEPVAELRPVLTFKAWT
jgi:tRNA-splicing ligase RtcB (3'-phosphate/5'-hydroxy nucleic acid ligase)